MIALQQGAYRLELSPERGGSILRFDWRGEPIMRPACGPSILDTACFPLVPFSNRIAGGRFTANGREVCLPPNCPQVDPLNPIHGYGWLSEWQVVSRDSTSAALEHANPGDAWPWRYRARQSFDLSDDGLDMTLSLTNLCDSLMPAGLGYHPYFPRTDRSYYRALHHGEWLNDDDCLPRLLDLQPEPRDWWDGRAVGARAVDTVYASREGPLVIGWPERDMEIEITPSSNLPFTVVYTPRGADFFCVEPVSQMTDAVNREEAANGLVWLQPGVTLTVGLRMKVR